MTWWSSLFGKSKREAPPPSHDSIGAASDVPTRTVELPVRQTPQYVNEPFEFNNPHIVSEDYIQIPGTQHVISRTEFGGHDYYKMRLSWEEAHFVLHENGLHMPTIPLFMRHFKNVVHVHRAGGKKQLFDAAGNRLTTVQAHDVFRYLTSNEQNYRGFKYGASTWLDALFEERPDGLYVLSEHRTDRDLNGSKKLAPTKAEPLAPYVMNSRLGDFTSLNSQGLPTRVSKDALVYSGSLYFTAPSNGYVAAFEHGRGGGYVTLSCGRGRGGDDHFFAVAGARS